MHKPQVKLSKFILNWTALRNYKIIGHVLNEQGTRYEYLKSIELKNGAHHLKEHPNISKFTKFESCWLRR